MQGPGHRNSRIKSYVISLIVAATSHVADAHASITVLVGEPFGNFGTMMPVGHTSIYLDQVCADNPLKLRLCHPGEPQGVVIARYHGIAKIDWIATPVMEFLYATERPEDVLSYASLETTWELRQIYRKRFLKEIVPDGHEYDKATDEWWETAGMAYTRRLWGYQLASTREQDKAFIEALNARENRHAYRLNTRNCADFAADTVNFFYPGSVKRNHIADFGWMMPKQVARSVEVYGLAHPELNLKVFEIPQIPGSLRRSRPALGAAEGLLKTKRYLFTLLVIQPEAPPILAVMYLDQGRWKIGRGAQVIGPEAFDSEIELATK